MLVPAVNAVLNRSGRNRHPCCLGNPMDCSSSGSSVPGIFQAGILEWVAFPSPGDLPDPGLEPASPALACGFFTTKPFGKHNRHPYCVPYLKTETFSVIVIKCDVLWRAPFLLQCPPALPPLRKFNILLTVRRNA